jgi:transcriptional regulator with XRE-family HTH domain
MQASCGTRAVARNLRVLTHAKGVSQEELADRAYINRNYVGMLASGRNIPPRSTGWKNLLTSSK